MDPTIADKHHINAIAYTNGILSEENEQYDNYQEARLLDVHALEIVQMNVPCQFKVTARKYQNNGRQASIITSSADRFLCLTGNQQLTRLILSRDYKQTNMATQVPHT